MASFETLPWAIAVSYALNGVEELAGRTGVAETALDILSDASIITSALVRFCGEVEETDNQMVLQIVQMVCRRILSRYPPAFV